MDNEEKFYIQTAIDILKNRFGIYQPTEKHIEDMREILFSTWLKRTIIFDKQLTDREKVCLYLASIGKESRETADFLGIGIETVKTHRKEIIRKLKCKNITQAVSLGIKYGEVSA